MKGVNHLKVFGIIVIVFMTLITIGYTMNQETRNPLPERVIKDGMTVVQSGYTGIVEGVKRFLTNINDLFHTYEENKLLKQQMYNYEALEVYTNQLEEQLASLEELQETGASLTNYQTINVEAQEEDPDSILNFYKEMIALRKSEDIFVYGTYDLVFEDHQEIYAYTRTLGEKRVLILCNLTNKQTSINLEKITVSTDQLLLSNIPVEEHESIQELTLKPFEARIYSLN